MSTTYYLGIDGGGTKCKARLEDFDKAIDSIKQATAYIDHLCQQIATYNPQRLSFIGGLSDKLIPWLSEDMVNRISPALHKPEVGAILIARQLHFEQLQTAAVQ
ncbi:hypothetical protein [Glaciecola sp. 1036]|uniref:hypothetical protein n=1 Tax=Alteromonadaceae TaxID=72275 RepID=UPI003D010EEC